jgi:predicted secreted Zn-dependent protease
MPRLDKILRCCRLPIFLTIASCGFIVSNKQAIAQNTPNVSIKTNYYDIQGSTAKQLRSQLNQLGAVDPKTGKRFDARVNWQVSWQYRYRPVSNQCQITQATVNVQVIYTMPRWNPSANASIDLKNRWNRYITALRQHEDGHKNHGVKAGQEILKTLNNLTTDSCQRIGDIANQKGDAIIKQYNLKDIEYDHLTQHGFTQGAVFP